MIERAAMRRLLWRWGRVLEFCTAKDRELEFFTDKLESSRDLRGRAIDGQPRGSGISDPTARAVLGMETIFESYAELVEDVAQDIKAEKQFKRAMDERIDELPHEQRRILELRYIDGHQWTFIAIKMCMDESTARRLESQAVDYLAGEICAEISAHM